MVDINLFKDDDEKEWDPSSEKGDDFGDELKDDFDLEGDFEESPSLEEDSLLGDIDTIPDLDESLDNEQEEDYEIGDITKKRTSPVIWIVLLFVIIVASWYWFVYQPKEREKLKTPALVMRSRGNTNLPGAGKDSSATIQKVPAQQPSPVPSPTETISEVMNGDIPKAVVTIPTMVKATKDVFNDLVRSGQFAAVLVNGNRFMVEYVSETPGVANSMGHRVRTLLGTTGYKVSPEERHRTSGKLYYWGVISGTLPQGTQPVSTAAAKQFANMDVFIGEMRGVASRHNLAVREIEKLSSDSDVNLKRKLIKLTVAGSKANAFSFLESLNEFQGSAALAKLLLVPEVYSDFKAEKVKLVVDFLVLVK